MCIKSAKIYSEICAYHQWTMHKYLCIIKLQSNKGNKSSEGRREYRQGKQEGNARVKKDKRD